MASTPSADIRATGSDTYPPIPSITECCTECFRLLHSHIKSLFEQSGYSRGYRRAFVTLFGHDIESFTVTMTLYLDQLQQQMDRADFSESCCTAAYGVILKQLQAFIDSKFTLEYDHYSQMTKKCFADHTGIEVDMFRDTLI